MGKGDTYSDVGNVCLMTDQLFQLQEKKTLSETGVGLTRLCVALNTTSWHLLALNQHQKICI